MCLISEFAVESNYQTNLCAVTSDISVHGFPCEKLLKIQCLLVNAFKQPLFLEVV